MAGEAAIGFSVYAALEADEARQAAEKAEARAFMETYSHRAATPEERRRYVETVRAMYPARQESQELHPVAIKCIGGCIVLAFLIPAIGAAYGWFMLDGDMNEGVMRALEVAFWITVALFGLAILGGGLVMLFS